MHSRFCGGETGSIVIAFDRPVVNGCVQHAADHPRHCERSEAIHSGKWRGGLLRCARNDGWMDRTRPSGKRRKILRRLFRGLALAQEAAEQALSVLARDQVDVADELGAALAALQHDLSAVK